MTQETNTKTINLSTHEIWQEYSLDLRRFIFSKVFDNDIVDDILQEVFFSIHTKIQTLKDNAKLGSWLFQVARNQIIDYFRSETKNRQLLEKIENDSLYVNTISVDILQYCMKFFISQLPDLFKDAIIFTDIEGNTQKEFAEKEGISISAAKSRVQRARAKLKEIVVGYTGFEVGLQTVNPNELTDYCPITKK